MMVFNDKRQVDARGHGGRERRWIRRLGAGILALAFVLSALFIVANLTTESSYWSRIIAWRDASFDDFVKKFAARPIPNGSATFEFRPAAAATPSFLKTVTYQQGGREATAPLEGFLASTGTTAFLIKDDQLLYEGYFNGSDHTATLTSFSVAKSFGSALVGIAIAEGRIGGIDDPITRYIPELAGRPGLDRIHIRHLLTMTSGLRYNGTGSGGGPFSDDARSYYDPDLRALALSVQAEIPPGVRWQYDNFHPLLLGIILERATGRTVSAYLSEKLWQPLGMEAPGSWSLDSRHNGFEKMESGRRLSLASRRQLAEALAGFDQDSGIARRGLVATDDHVDIKRIEFDAAADSAGLLGRDEGRARAEERVDDNVAPVGEVQQRVLEHGGRLDGRSGM